MTHPVDALAESVATGYAARFGSAPTGLWSAPGRDVITENDRVEETVRLLEERGPRAIGPLLDASHLSMRDDFEISVPELDLAVDVSRANGAIGARMTGGGFGGSSLAIVPRTVRLSLETAILSAFAERGFGTPDLFAVRPSGGATMSGELL